ncbi:MAG: hypothetical protein H7Y89_14905 [Steroidobacteraceae bacterium]|nr:hypothetical protein [Steroidobacteraceae bacterium]
MTRKHGPALLLSLAVCTGAQASDGEFCRRIAAFADAAPAAKAHEITILTDWSEEPTIGCRRDESAAAIAICAWLPPHLSIEFMQGNVSRVLECFSKRSRLAATEIFGGLAGKIRVSDPRYVTRKIWIELEFSTVGKDGALSFLTIRSGYRD